MRTNVRQIADHRRRPGLPTSSQTAPIFALLGSLRSSAGTTHQGAAQTSLFTRTPTDGCRHPTFTAVSLDPNRWDHHHHAGVQVRFYRTLPRSLGAIDVPPAGLGARLVRFFMLLVRSYGR